MSEHDPHQPQFSAISGAAFEAAAERLQRALMGLDARSVAVKAAIARVEDGGSLTADGVQSDTAHLAAALAASQAREAELSQAAAEVSDLLGSLIEEVRAAVRAANALEMEQGA